MIKAKINNKILKVKIVDTNYNDDSVEVIIQEGTFKGRYAIILKSDIIDNRIESAIEYLENTISNTYEDINNLSSDINQCDEEVFGDIYLDTYKNLSIYISVSIDENNNLTYDCSSKNNNRKEYDIYEDEYKNKKTVKTAKGVLGYIKKFVV